MILIIGIKSMIRYVFNCYHLFLIIFPIQKCFAILPEFDAFRLLCSHIYILFSWLTISQTHGCEVYVCVSFVAVTMCITKSANGRTTVGLLSFFDCFVFSQSVSTYANRVVNVFFTFMFGFRSKSFRSLRNRVYK